MSLPAVILVGGQGTRLRPLTDTTRKDMLPLVDRPLLAYTFEHLARHGVERAVVSCGHLPDQIAATFGQGYGGLSLEYAVEPTPLGTGGGIAFAARGLEGSFFALNGDSLREADLTELVRLHRSSGAKATILLTPVADPSRYGLVRLADDGRVESFLEKPRPEEIDTDLINAGLYVLEPDALAGIPEGHAVSIEREVFPRLAAEGAVYGTALEGYWLDVGTPETYLKWLLLERFFPATKQRLPVPSPLPSVAAVRAERFAGSYISLTSCFSCQAVRAGSGMTVTANADGTLAFAGGRWIAVDSLRFVRENGTGYIVFRADSSGAVRELFAGGPWAWQKAP